MELENENEDGSENINDSISSENSYDSGKENILFNIDVKLSGNKIAKLIINENDNINEKINYFCEAYKIKKELQPKIQKIVENKLNQELSHIKNSSTTYSSKQNLNNKDNREFVPVQDKLLERIENESESISEQDDNIKNKNINNDKKMNLIENNIDSKININNNNKVKKEEINAFQKNTNKNINNINTKTIKPKNQVKNQNIINNKLTNKKINNNIIKNKKIKDNNINIINKNYKSKKINVIQMNNKELIKKRPNSARDKVKSLNSEDSSINRLYNNNANSPVKKNLLLQQKYKERYKEIFKFSPEINKNSKKIFEKNNYLINNQKVEDRLINYGNIMNQKLLNEKTNILLNDIKDITFSPKIDKNSRHIAETTKQERISKLSAIESAINNNNNKKRKNIKIMDLKKPIKKRNRSQGDNNPNNIINTFVSFGNINNNISNEERQSYVLTENFGPYNPDKNIFDCLYLESKLDKIKKQKEINKQFKDRYTFRPLISNLAKELKKENKETKKEFIERMSSLGKKDKKHLQGKNYEENNKHNFKPKIGRGPKNEKQRDIDINLKGYYDKRIIKQKEDLKNDEIKNNKEKKKYYFKKSSEIIMKIKCEKYKILFEKLDSDKDGLISYDKIKLTGINKDILNDINPVLKELYDTKKSFDFKTFCNKVHNLLNDKNVDNI